MPCCSAVDCSNRSEKGFKLFRFPKDDRRAKWVQNMRRGAKWSPTDSSRLCERHFENSQFESHRLDSWRKLKPNAIPTVFNVPNSPPMFDPPPRKSLYKFSKTARTITVPTADLITIMPRLKKRSLETKARISRMKRAEKRREQILILKTQAEEMEILCRGIRSEGALVPPIRQTASIFKQPVTVHKNQEGKVKADFKHGRQEKPRQVFWEKRLEGIRASEKDGYELGTRWTGLLRPAGPHVSDDTLLQSVATALHVCAMPVTGQPPMRSHYDKEIVYRIPDQPLVQEVSVTVEDIKSQEERVIAARKRLQEVMWISTKRTPINIVLKRTKTLICIQQD